MSIQPGMAYWVLLENEFWPAMAVDAETTEGVAIPEDGNTYQVIQYFTGELGAAPVQTLSEVQFDNSDKFKPENPEIKTAIDAMFAAMYPAGDYTVADMERDILAAAENGAANVPNAAGGDDSSEESGSEDGEKKKGHKERNETKEERKARRDAKKARKAEREARKAKEEEEAAAEKQRRKEEKKKEKEAKKEAEKADKAEKRAERERKAAEKKAEQKKKKRGRDDGEDASESDGHIHSASDVEDEGDSLPDDKYGAYAGEVGQVEYGDHYATGLDRKGPRDRHADPGAAHFSHTSNMVAIARNHGVDRGLLHDAETNYDHVMNRVRADVVEKQQNQIAGGGTLATDAGNKYGRMIEPLMLPEGKHEYVKKIVKREEDIARWTAIVESASQAEGETSSSKKKKSIVPKDENPSVVEEPEAKPRRLPPRFVTIDSRARLPDSIPDAVSTNLVGHVHGVAIPEVSESEFPRSRLLKEEERLGRGNQLMSLKTPGVMNTWLALRDRVETVPQDVHAVRAFGATASQYDRPQAKLAEKAVAYSKKRQVDLPKSQRGSGTLTQLIGGGDGSAADLANQQAALLAGYSQNGMDYSDFQFNQTLDVMKQKSLQEMVPIESARVQQPSSNYFPDSQKMGGETQEAAERSAGYFATESEKYELPGSIFHRNGTADSMPYNGAGTDVQSTQGGGGGSQRASTTGTRGNAEAVASRKKFREAAAKIVTVELTPYFKGSLGKPIVIESLEEFKTLARKLTDRALEGKLHRSGEALATPAQRIIICTTNDKKSLTAEIRTYMEDLAVKKRNERR